MTVKALVKDYDRIVALRDGLAEELKLDITGDGRRERIATIAAAARAGDPLPNVRFDRVQRELELKGCDSAIEAVSIDLAEQLAEGREHRPRSAALPELQPTGEAMCAAIEANYDASDRRVAANTEMSSERHAYEDALNVYNERRNELIEEGVEPQIASETTKREMGSQADDLFMKGAPGTYTYHGRVVDHVTIGAPA